MSAYLRLILFVTVGLGVVLCADHNNVLAGKWQLNKAKSKFEGPVTRSSTIDCTEDVCTVDEVSEEGKRQRWSYSANVGSDHTITVTEGDGMKDMTVNTRHPNARTIEHIWNVNRKEIGKGVGVLSADGKTLTYTYTGNRDGKAHKDVMIFERK